VAAENPTHDLATEALRVAHAAQATANHAASEVAMYQRIQAEQTAALGRLSDGVNNMAIAQAGIGADLKWIREDLKRKVDAVSATANNEKGAKGVASTAQLLSVIAILAAIIAAIFGIKPIVF
jgi:hypothetical protein